MRFDLSDKEWALLEPLMPENPTARTCLSLGPQHGRNPAEKLLRGHSF